MGIALHECAGALFIGQAYGLELTFGAQCTVVTLALITSMGIAGIPAASLVAIVRTGYGKDAEANTRADFVVDDLPAAVALILG